MSRHMAPRGMAPRGAHRVATPDRRTDRTMAPGGLMAIALGATMIVGAMAHTAPPVAGQATMSTAHIAPPVVPPTAICAAEDGSTPGQSFPCLWDAPVRGNGTGRSFYLASPDGAPFYFGTVSTAR